MEESINKLHKTCIVKGCENRPQLKMCSSHLVNPIRDKIEIVENVVIEPPLIKSSSSKIQLAQNLLAISPLNLKLHKKAKRQFSTLKSESLNRNKENLIVTELKPCGLNNNQFYSDSDETCLSSNGFRQFMPMETRHQLGICSETRQLIFFIPCTKSFDQTKQQALKNCLLETLKLRPNNINKLSKKRRVEAKKWVFAGCKFSSFENPLTSENPPGVTNYALSKKFKGKEEENEKELQECLKSMTHVYRKCIPDIIKRHESIHKYLVSSPLSIRGASIGKK